MSNNSLNNQTTDASFDINRTTAGQPARCLINHTDGTNTASEACVITQTAPGGGDSYHLTMVNGTRSMCWGMDVSDNYTLKETTFAGGTGSPSFGTTIRAMTINGEQTLPRQPVFFAQLSANDPNVTGAGAAYLFGTTGNVLTVNQQGSWVSTLGVVTIPVTGWYEFEYSMVIDNLTAAMTNGQVVWYLNGGATQLVAEAFNIGAIRTPANSYVLGRSIRFNAAAGSTLQLSLTIANGSGNTAQVRGVLGGVAQSWFSGALIC